MGTSALLHFAFAVQITLGIVFLLSVLPKLRRPYEFAQSVAEYNILPVRIAYIFGYVMILAEGFLAVAFLSGWLANIALPLTMAILIALFIAVGVNLRRGRQIACGCFGDAREQISPRTLARLLLLMFGTVILIIIRGATGKPVPELALLVSDNFSVLALTYIIDAALLAVFLILLGSWTLNIPELASLAHSPHSTESSSSTSNAEIRTHAE